MLLGDIGIPGGRAPYMTRRSSFNEAVLFSVRSTVLESNIPAPQHTIGLVRTDRVYDRPNPFVSQVDDDDRGMSAKDQELCARDPFCLCRRPIRPIGPVLAADPGLSRARSGHCRRI